MSVKGTDPRTFGAARLWTAVAIGLVGLSVVACSGEKGETGVNNGGSDGGDSISDGGGTNGPGTDAGPDAGTDAGSDVTIDPGGTLGVPWVDVSPQNRFPGRAVYDTMAYDAARGQAVLVKDSGTWVWNRARWERVAEPPGGLEREGHGMAWDAAHELVVLFGGRVGTDALDDTWTWDGVAWSEQQPATRPGAAYFQGIAYDAAREVVVMHGGGGFDGNSIRGTTWEWDGADWSDVTPAENPGARSSTVMTYDAARQRIVLYGGQRSGGFLGDVWEFDGTTWTDVSPTEGAPPIRNFTTLVYDPQRHASLLIGGERANNLFGDTWSWDGTTWTELTDEVGALSNRWAHAATYDEGAGRVLLYGGLGPEGDPRTGEVNETRALDAEGQWLDVSPDVTAPPRAAGAAMAWDAEREEVVMFGGDNRAVTWIWDGELWRDASPATGPSQRLSPSMAFDAARAEVVMFGGAYGSALGDTWTWDGQSWTAKTVSEAPSARSDARMTYDPRRERVVLYGGLAPDGGWLETWEWDGTTWTLTDDVGLGMIPTSPLAMVYDPVRQAPLIVAGVRESADLRTVVFEYTGSGWDPIATTSELEPARVTSAAFWDSRRSSLILFGGSPDNSNALDDTWELVGTTWRELSPVNRPPARWAHAMTYDGARGRGFMFGGTQLIADTWEWNGAVAEVVDP